MTANGQRETFDQLAARTGWTKDDLSPSGWWAGCNAIYRKTGEVEEVVSMRLFGWTEEVRQLVYSRRGGRAEGVEIPRRKKTIAKAIFDGRAAEVLSPPTMQTAGPYHRN